MKRNLKHFARRLRKDATDVETLLWRHLRGRRFAHVKFRRQEPIAGYIVDFVSYEKRLIIELDGGQHAEDPARDRQRDSDLEERGFTVLRFWNGEILLQLDAVLDVVFRECGK